MSATPHISPLPAVLATTRFVVENARFVIIDQDRVQAVADELVRRGVQPVAYDCHRHLCGPDPAVANFVLVLDTLNFSFWPDPGIPRWRVTYQGETLDGYWALVAALRRAHDEGIPITDAAYLATLDQPALQHVLRGEGEIPLLAERVAALREVGRGLRDLYDGQFVKMIERAGHNALVLTGLLANEFSSFNDVSVYGGELVEVYKRAQICCSDLSGASQGAPWGRLADLDKLTAFADYKVPQVLRQLGILVYTEALASVVDQLLPLPHGSDGEIEIRAGTIWGVEYLRRALANRGIDVDAYRLDWHLWELGQDLPPNTQPYHRSRTIFY
ncbi:MAG TPA: queuosine salvage family protein [Chloroflexota bacterium]|nr:queuosine salvage family protein [Chloroflexota bacterium]